MNKRYKSLIKKIAPVHKHELAKFLCIATMIILVVYIHYVARISRDALIISHLGTETISAIKMWAVLPISMLFMLIYIKLSDVFNRSHLFHTMCWFFISYYVLFALVLYPHREALSINVSEALVLKLPALKYLFVIITNWPCCLFYVFSEAWVVIMLAISFWQIANHICTIEEAKRFYPLLGLLSQIGLMIAAFLSKSFVVEGSDWQPTLNHAVTSIVIAGMLLSLSVIALGKIIGLDFLNRKKPHFSTRKKASFKENLQYIISSKPILLITSLLLCYNISLNLAEGVWKKSVEVFFASNANHIHSFMSSVNIYISILSILCAFVGVYTLQTCKWLTSALITPVAIIITGGAFFIFMLSKDSSSVHAIGIPVLAIAVYFGAMSNIFARATKHTIFDSTKEMVYIPLDDDLQTKGKAAAETVGMRLGQGSGSFIQQLLFIVLPGLTLIDLAPIISGIFLVTLLWWFYSVFVLNKYLASKT